MPDDATPPDSGLSLEEIQREIGQLPAHAVGRAEEWLQQTGRASRESRDGHLLVLGFATGVALYRNLGWGFPQTGRNTS